MTTPEYTVHIQPLIDAGNYGVNTDVSDYVDPAGISIITRMLQSYNYDVGSYLFANTTIKCTNKNGYFNDGGDLFTFKRDLAKVQLKYWDKNGSNIDFHGLIDERATAFGVNNDQVTFTILGRDSVFSQVSVDSGDISNSDLFSTAIKSILNKSAITMVLNYSASNINVALDRAIDVASVFVGMTVKDALDQLLLASNSVLYVDDDGNIIVTSRTQNDTKVTYYGDGDDFGRDNIIQIFNYNTGYHRIFNSVWVNDRETKDSTSISNYGTRKLELSLDFITSTTTADDIAASVLAEFKDPKRELFIKVKNEEMRNVSLLNEIELNLEPSVYNQVDIETEDRWKLLGINEYPSNFTADLKLREI